jgi:hypothetical protein
MILKQVLKSVSYRVWTGFNYLRIEFDEGLL